jgi:UDP-glucose 4-epimerase
MMNLGRVVVTGAAGFIGSNLVDHLLSKGFQVIGMDNFSTGTEKFIQNALKNKNFTMINCDLLDRDKVVSYFSGCDFVFHLAANADVRSGTDHPSKDLEQNTIATFNVLEAMRAHSISKIVFASTGAMYGEAKIFPTPEDTSMPIQTSLYGASKLACESMIQAYCEGFNMQSWIFRFVSILGHRYTHGHVYDFCKQLQEDPTKLYVLGDGLQKKSYLHIEDCISAIWTGISKSKEKVNIFNLGASDYCQVKDSVKWITNRMKLEPAITYSGGKRGWIGDNPFVFLQTDKIRSLGWEEKYTIKEGVEKTVDFLSDNLWVFDFRN